MVALKRAVSLCPRLVFTDERRHDDVGERHDRPSYDHGRSGAHVELMLPGVPDHLTNRTPGTLDVARGQFPALVAAAGATAKPSTSCGFSFTESGMMMPHAVFPLSA